MKLSCLLLLVLVCAVGVVVCANWFPQQQLRNYGYGYGQYYLMPLPPAAGGIGGGVGGSQAGLLGLGIGGLVALLLLFLIILPGNFVSNGFSNLMNGGNGGSNGNGTYVPPGGNVPGK